MRDTAIQQPVGARQARFLNTDAVHKGGHYAECGTSVTAAHVEAKLSPAFSDFTSSFAEQSYPHLLAAGRQTEKDKDTCTANLSCARPVAGSKGTVLDVQCFAGAVCSCGVPIQGMFLSSEVPECFAVYVSMLASLEVAIRNGDKAAAAIKAVLLDIGCQFGPRLNFIGQAACRTSASS